MKHLLLQGRNGTKAEERLGLRPRICLPTYKPRKGKAKEKPFNFLLHRFGIEINQWQMKSTTESNRVKKKPKFVLDKRWVKRLETLRQECSFKKHKEIEETKNTLLSMLIEKFPKTTLTPKYKTKWTTQIPQP